MYAIRSYYATFLSWRSLRPEEAAVSSRLTITHMTPAKTRERLLSDIGYPPPESESDFNMIQQRGKDVHEENGQHHAFGIVITSYSIHYTKLYDMDLKECVRIRTKEKGPAAIG